MDDEQHRKKQLNDLQAECAILDEKIREMRQRSITEANPSLRLKLKMEIWEALDQRDQLMEEIDQFEQMAFSSKHAIPDANQNPARSNQPVLWNIPFAHNPFFTGREEELAQLQTQLQNNPTITLAIRGIGGIGKTQLALEYAHRHRADYSSILWVRADTPESLNASYCELARLLDLYEKDAEKQEIVIQSVKHWLHTHWNYLLILDNADEPEALAPFLPSTPGGHLLITTRATELSHMSQSIVQLLPLAIFSPDQGALFLLRRATLLLSDSPLDQAPSDVQELARKITSELGGLPLALDQAGAYLATTSTSLADYLQLFQRDHADLLKEHHSQEYPASVATTWNISFGKLIKTNHAAADLLRFCAFLAPDVIPEEILTAGAHELGRPLAHVATNPLQLNKTIAALSAYSLITRDPDTQTLIVHPLVQAVVRDMLSTHKRWKFLNNSRDTHPQKEWMQRAVQAVNAAFSGTEFEDWPVCERLLPHALICAAWIEQGLVKTPEGSRLLNQTAVYLKSRGRYAEAEPLYRHALAIYEQELGPQHPYTATSLNNLALLYNIQGKFSEAEPLYQRSLALCEQQLGPLHPNTATSLNNLALLYKSQGKLTEAEPLYQRSLAICEQLLGPLHPNTAGCLNNLAGLYKSQGKFAEAEPLYQRALAIREQELGQLHPSTATSLNNLAVLYNDQGRFAEAEPLYQRALAIREQLLGPLHPDTTNSLSNLAALYTEQGKLADARLLLHRVLDSYEKMLGAEHPDTQDALRSYKLLQQKMKQDVQSN